MADLNEMFLGGTKQTPEEESYNNGYTAGVIAVNELTKRFAEVYGPNADPHVMRGIFDAIRNEI